MRPTTAPMNSGLVNWIMPPSPGEIKLLQRKREMNKAKTTTADLRNIVFISASQQSQYECSQTQYQHQPYDYTNEKGVTRGNNHFQGLSCPHANN